MKLNVNCFFFSIYPIMGALKCKILCSTNFFKDYVTTRDQKENIDHEKDLAYNYYSAKQLMSSEALLNEENKALWN